jgi:hypothetical protein
VAPFLPFFSPRLTCSPFFFPLPSFQAVLADALDLLEAVHALLRFKSGLPPGAGRGAGELVRAAARELLPLVVDARRLAVERSRNAPPADPHRARLRRNPARRVPAPPPPFAALHASLRPPDAWARPLEEEAASPVSALLDFGAFEPDSFGASDAAAAPEAADAFGNFRGSVGGSFGDSWDAAADPFASPAAEHVVASQASGDWDDHWLDEGDPFAAPHVDPFAADPFAAPPAATGDPFAPPPAPTGDPMSAPASAPFAASAAPASAPASSSNNSSDAMWDLLRSDPLGPAGRSKQKSNGAASLDGAPPSTDPFSHFGGMFGIIER